MGATTGSDDPRTPALDVDPAPNPRISNGSRWARTRSLVKRPLISYVIAFVLALGVYHHAYGTLAVQGMTGDEPSYMLDAISMARDGDRNLSNQYSVTNPQSLIKLFGIPAYPHIVKDTGAGAISWHGAGVGFAVVPGVWIGDWQGNNPIRWVRLELVLIDALAALALYGVLRRVAQLLNIRTAFVWVAWASAALSLPLVAYSDQLYPEVPALLCILLAINAALRPRPRWPVIAAGSIAASYLPWLHVRFIPTCLALLAALALRGLSAVAARDHPPSHAPQKRLAAYGGELRRLSGALRSRAGLAMIFAAALPGLVSFGFMAVEFQRWYGSPSWTIAATGGGVPTIVTNTWYPAVLGGLFGTDYGWVPWAPVAVLGLAAIGCLLLEAPRWTAYALLVACVYQAELAFSGIATPGFVFPGRYEIVWIPLLAVPLMVALARIPVTWLAFVPLMIATIAVSWQAADERGNNLLNTGTVGLPMAARLSSAFPDVENPSSPTSFSAKPADLKGTSGRLARGGAVRRAVPSDKAGFLIAGPGIQLAPGVYTAHFVVNQTGARGAAPFVDLQVWSLSNTATLASVTLTARDLPPGRPKAIALRFTTPGALPIETRVFVTGQATVEVGPTSATPIVLAPMPTTDNFPDGSLMAAWIGGTLFLGVLLVNVQLLRRRVAKRERTVVAHG
jgi:hypothetical protein